MRIFAIVCLITFSTLCHAEDVYVVTGTWQDYAQRDGNGFYLDILKDVYLVPYYNLKIEHVPFKQSLLMLASGKADIALAVYKGDLPEKYLNKYYLIDDAVDVAVSKELAGKWHGLGTLENKRVAALIGYAFDTAIEVPIDYSEKPDLLGMMKMLRMGRIDALLDYRAELSLLWDKAGLGDNFTIIKGVIHKKVYFAFAENRGDLKKYFDKKILRLINSGRLNELGQKYGIDESVLP